MHTAKQISDNLAQRLDQVVPYLLPDARVKGNEWVIGSLNGEKGESLKISRSNEKLGIWSDFAIGDSGDILDLWHRVRSLSLREAIAEAKQWLGIAEVRFKPERATNESRIIQRNWQEVKESSPAGCYLIDKRKLTPATLQTFQVGETGREMVFPYLREDLLSFVKYLGIERVNDAKSIRIMPGCLPVLFGWQAISPHT
jgi:twinkle protein